LQDAENQVPASESNLSPEISAARPSSATNHAKSARATSSRPSSATASDTLQVAENQVPASESDLSSEISTASFQGSEVVSESMNQGSENKNDIRHESSDPLKTLEKRLENEQARTIESVGNSVAEEVHARPCEDDTAEILAATLQVAQNREAADDQPKSADTAQAADGTLETNGMIPREPATDRPVVKNAYETESND
jgi:hypothetical protein